MGYVAELFDPRWAALDMWQGQGQIKWGQDDTYECPCEVIILSDGNPVVFCSLDGKARWRAFSHKLTELSVHCEGVLLHSEGGISGSNLEGGGDEGYNRRLGPQKLIATPERDSISEPDVVQFGLTNYVTFPGKDNQPIEVCLDLPRLGEREVLIEPSADFCVLKERSRILRKPHLTARLELAISGEEELSMAEEDVDDVCALLSVAQGCAVNWVKYDVLTADEEVCYQVFGSRKTAPYCPLRIVDSNIPEYLENTYPIYAERRDRWHLDRGIVAAYLEGKDETDYLDTRAAKLALGLEMMVDRICEAEGFDGWILEQDTFDEIEEALKNAIRCEIDSATQRAKLYEHLRGINRASFREKIDFLLTQIDAEYEEEEVRRFIKYRNCLIHRGRFYCSLPKERQSGNMALHSPSDEYFFMVEFMDRLLLRIVGYAGKYVDASERWRTYKDLGRE